MEKAPLLSGSQSHQNSWKKTPTIRNHSRVRWIGGAWLVLCFVFIAFAFREELNASRLLNYPEEREKSFGWDDIKPTQSLNFYPCFETYECARLDVPLDWSPNSKSSKRAAVALTKIPAKVPVTDPRYGGAVLINPGGPGGSGVQAVTDYGPDVQKIVDWPSDPSIASEGKYFDIIGFDPRGINNTTPKATCFPDDGARDVWDVAMHTEGLPSNATFSHVWSRTEAFSGSCTKRMDSEEEDHVGRHVNTVVVVEDMIAIAEALGEWREKKAKEEVKHLTISQRTAALERTKWRKGREKVLYWGFSYGTLLGATLASMHPDRLERVAVDGVGDSEDYYDGYWLMNLQDTDLIMEKFHEDCYAAGPEKCALWRGLGSSHSQLVLDRVLERLERSPLPVPASGNRGPEIITYTDLMLLIRAALYSPRDWFPYLARAVAAIDEGNGTEIAVLKQSQYGSFCRTPLCSQNPWSTDCHDPIKAALESGRAILCTDAPDHTDWTEAYHYQKYLTLVGQSKYLGASWSEITMYCAHWNIRPAWDYTPSLKGNTSIPILWIGNTRDPVTPLRNAVKMAKKFPGSAILRLDADGHCSLSAPSKCTAKWIRKYFQEGALPPDDIMCKPDRGTFDGRHADFPRPATMSQEDWELSLALERLSHGFGRSGPLGF